MMENKTAIRTLISPWESKDASYIDEWFLVGSPLQCYLVLVSYLAFVLKIGPYLMKHRAPFKLTNIILIYNILQVILSGYIFKLATAILFQTGLVSDKCVNDSAELQYEYYYGMHVYMLAKLSELLDTIFFVLRKKDGQVSFLHVYHHCGIFLYSWTGLSNKYTVLSVIVLGFLNSFIHLIMYSYYAMSVFPSISKYIWWKKYITSMQITQFVLIMMYVIFEYTTSPCKFPRTLLVNFILNLSLVSYLFVDFYRKSYKSQVSKNK